ncbi:Band 4.1-like protein 2 [Chionoecetes opilio]|uniref:Band 4.1-like protein 2 n=1 Tax=Chionoecetes opilio TaxID=41210 RepID=A0A8J5CJB9_CHIOP|nr:Band 4.1-like protein 2 [Chionoecetes opilio]
MPEGKISKEEEEEGGGGGENGVSKKKGGGGGGGGGRRGKMVLAKITLLDGAECEVVVEKKSKGQDVINAIAEKMNLLEKDYFGLCYYEAGEIAWICPEKKVSKQIKHRPWCFNFRVKFYPPDPSQLAEDITRYQLCLQRYSRVIQSGLVFHGLVFTRSLVSRSLVFSGLLVFQRLVFSVRSCSAVSSCSALRSSVVSAVFVFSCLLVFTSALVRSSRVQRSLVFSGLVFSVPLVFRERSLVFSGLSCVRAVSVFTGLLVVTGLVVFSAVPSCSASLVSAVSSCSAVLVFTRGDEVLEEMLEDKEEMAEEMRFARGDVRG